MRRRQGTSLLRKIKDLLQKSWPAFHLTIAEQVKALKSRLPVPFAYGGYSGSVFPCAVRQGLIFVCIGLSHSNRERPYKHGKIWWKSWQGKMFSLLGLIYMHAFNEWYIM